jgi:hypothetical protein
LLVLLEGVVDGLVVDVGFAGGLAEGGGRHRPLKLLLLARNVQLLIYFVLTDTVFIAGDQFTEFFVADELVSFMVTPSQYGL